MPVKLSRKQPAVFHSVPSKQRQPQRLRRMPPVESASRPPFATSDEYVTLTARRAKREAAEIVPETTNDPPRGGLHQQHIPRCVALSVNSTQKTHILSPLGDNTLSLNLQRTKQNYKEKLTLVKAKLKQRRHFRRSHQRYVVPTQPPTSAECRMVVPPTSTPPGARNAPAPLPLPTLFSKAVSLQPRPYPYPQQQQQQHGNRTHLQPRLTEYNSFEDFKSCMSTCVSTTTVTTSMEKARNEATVQKTRQTLQRASTAPTTLMQRRRGFQISPLNPEVYPFGKHANNIEKQQP